MAKVNFGTIANDARGKINGIVYSKNKSGSYTRRKVTPANPNSPAQTFVRTNFSVLSRNWSGVLTAAQRAAWIAYAATYPRIDVFGNSIRLSGINMYISLNQVLLTITKPVVNNPPASNVISPVPFDPLSLVAISTGISLTFMQTAANPTGINLYIFGHAPIPAGRTPTKSAFVFLASLGSASGPFPQSIAVGSTYAGRFGTWAAGQNIALLVASVDTTSGLTTVGTIMQAPST